MRPPCGRHGAAIMAVLLSSLAAGPLWGQCAFEVTAIVQAPPCGFTGPAASTAFAINDAGVISGRYFQCVESDFEAFTYSPTAGFVTLPRPAISQGAEALDLNNTGWVVGCVEISNRCHAALWRGGAVILLGTMPGGNFSVASGVNDSGVIVGWWGNTATGDPARAAFRWVGGVMSTIELPMGPNAVAVDVNEAGAITGWMGQALHIDAHGFIYEGGTVTDLGVIPGGYTAVPAAISDTDEVVGYGYLPSQAPPGFVRHAFLWDGEMLDLGTLPGLAECFARDVSEGRVVGYCWDFGTAARAFLWSDGQMLDLNHLLPADAGMTLWSAWGMNGAAQMTALNLSDDTVLLTPIERPIGDIDGDCQTGIEDLMILIDAFGQSGSPADLNGDGVVNVLDLIVLLLNFGS